jgi:hypothetical protein
VPSSGSAARRGLRPGKGRVIREPGWATDTLLLTVRRNPRHKVEELDLPDLHVRAA